MSPRPQDPQAFRTPRPLPPLDRQHSSRRWQDTALSQAAVKGLKSAGTLDVARCCIYVTKRTAAGPDVLLKSFSKQINTLTSGYKLVPELVQQAWAPPVVHVGALVRATAGRRRQPSPSGLRPPQLRRTSGVGISCLGANRSQRRRYRQSRRDGKSYPKPAATLAAGGCGNLISPPANIAPATITGSTSY
jgi:hypothetical protein